MLFGQRLSFFVVIFLPKIGPRLGETQRAPKYSSNPHAELGNFLVEVFVE